MENINENNIQEEYKPLNESVQIGDAVKLDGQKGFVIGQIDGKVIIQVQGNTSLVTPDKVKEYGKKPDLLTVPHMKFDEETQKLLFEQFVKCGVFMGNVPIKMSDCYVKYNQWEKAMPDQQIKVLIEGNTVFMPKSQVRIFEDLNNFANPDNYIPGVIVDEPTEIALENVLINAIDFSNAIGDADSVQIIRKAPDGTQEMQTMPRAALRTLSV
jgi:hypothetical protein